MAEKAIIVAGKPWDFHGKRSQDRRSEALDELNRHLAEGWTVKQTCSFGGTDSAAGAVLVVLQS